MVTTDTTSDVNEQLENAARRLNPAEIDGLLEMAANLQAWWVAPWLNDWAEEFAAWHRRSSHHLTAVWPRIDARQLNGSDLGRGILTAKTWLGGTLSPHLTNFCDMVLGILISEAVARLDGTPPCWEDELPCDS